MPRAGKKVKGYGMKNTKASQYNNGKVVKYGHYPAPNAMRQAGLAIIERSIQYVPIKINKMVI